MGRERDRRVGARAAATAAALAAALGLSLAQPGSAGAATRERARTAEASTPPTSLAFDTCDAPSLDAMRAWRSASPYTSVAIYIGGDMRACANSALDSPAWVNAVLDMGWGIIPVYVPPQAPCSDFHVQMNAANPELHGYFVAIHTIARARVAGIPAGAPIYLDVEPWGHDDPACSAAVGQFLSGWVKGLHEYGFSAGIYSTPLYGIQVQRAVAADPTRHAADTVWVAAWTGNPGATDALAGGAWAGQRIHQFLGDHVETWGGVELEVDSNWVDAPVLRSNTSALLGQ